MKRSRSDTEQPPFVSRLVLPHEHPLSLALARQADELRLDSPRGVLACSEMSAGLVELTLQAGRADGYGARAWPFFVGGAGLGDEPEMARMIGVPPRAPVAARFGVPVAMSGVDDSGCCDATFWEGLGDVPTLRAIAERAVAWLEGTHLSDDAAEARPQWEEAERHCRGKLQVIERYRQLALAPALVAEDTQLEAAWLAPELRELLAATEQKGGGGQSPTAAAAAAAAAAASRLLDSGAVREVAPGIFSLELFSQSFCAQLLAEIDHFEATDLPRRRPNTMNNYGLVVNEIGMERTMSQLLRRVVAPISAAAYPREDVVRALDHHHSFAVAYAAEGGDKGLDMHHDAAEVTLNVCLGRSFEGATLRFCGRFGGADHRRTQLVYSHAVGRALLHLGRQRHGADEIVSGERVNLIMWARSSAFRAAAAFGHIEPDGYPKAAEDGSPDRECLSKANDADFAQQLRKLGEEVAPSASGCATGTCPLRKKQVM